MPKLRHSLLAAAVSAALPLFAQAQPAPDLDSLTAAQAAADICAGKYTSEALVGAALARARARADLNAFITLDEAGALKAAKAADAARKGKRGACKPLDGVPVVIKDNIEVAGLPASAGTPALKGFVPKADAPVAAKLRAAGAIVLGKTNMHELAFGISGYNLAFKSGDKPGVRNAYDPTRIAGGSSSGSGAAIGARIALAGLGTDTGGSVRIPCALNGCASLRPTVGRYAQKGIAPISHTRDTAGPMGVCDGRRGAARPGNRRRRGGKTGRPEESSRRRGCGEHGEPRRGHQGGQQAALAKMKGAGVTVVEVDMPKLAELNGAVGFPVALYEAHDDMVKYLKASGSGKTIADVAKDIASPDVKGTYDGLVIPRKLPGPNNTLVDAKPAYDAAMKTGRPGAAEALQGYFRQKQARCNRLPHRAQGGHRVKSGFEQPRQFRDVHPEHRSGQQCRPSGPADSPSRWGRAASCRSAWSLTVRPAATGS